MECWGASGGNATYNSTVIKGGRGGYTCGCISLSTPLTLYVYVGEAGSYNPAPSNPNAVDEAEKGMTFNGGGAAQNHSCVTATGGGATDIRTTNGSWDNFNSLKARIIVAAGAGSCIAGSPLSYGGGLASVTYNNTYSGGGNTNAASAATQTSGYKFGIGQYGDRAGAGGGYYGGCAGTNLGEDITGLRGAGGSSFISGHTGCNAISESSTSSNIIHTGQPNHYSGYVFTNTVMKAGNEVMPSPTGGTETGHSGNGYCKITWHPAL